MDYFDDVTTFSFFHIKEKQHHRSIYRAEFSKYTKFHKNPLQIHVNMELKNGQRFQINVCQGATLAS